MNLIKIFRILSLTVVMTFVIAACDGEGAELTTTSILVTNGSAGGETGGSTTTSVDVSGTTTGGVETVGTAVDGYEIVAREVGETGEVLWIVVPQAAYTDVDLENFVGDLIETGVATWGAEVFDDVLALEAYQKDEADRSEEEVALIDTHHFVSLQNGDTLIFRGPFEASGEMVIGS